MSLQIDISHASGNVDYEEEEGWYIALHSVFNCPLSAQCRKASGHTAAWIANPMQYIVSFDQLFVIVLMFHSLACSRLNSFRRKIIAQKYTIVLLFIVENQIFILTLVKCRTLLATAAFEINIFYKIHEEILCRLNLNKFFFQTFILNFDKSKQTLDDEIGHESQCKKVFNKIRYKLLSTFLRRRVRTSWMDKCDRPCGTSCDAIAKSSGDEARNLF